MSTRRGPGLRAAGMGAFLLLHACGAHADLESALEAVKRGDFLHAVPELGALARDGDAAAQEALAVMYLKGVGVERSTATAMQWYCRRVHQREGGREAMHAAWFLAEFFRTGGGVPGKGYNAGRREDENPLRAYFWFSVMAAQAKLFDTRHADSERLGRIGMSAMSRVLFPEEKAALQAALSHWHPTRPVRSGEACLTLPDGLTSRKLDG